MPKKFFRINDVNPDKLEKVIDMCFEGIPFKEMRVKLNTNTFDLGDYIIHAFKQTRRPIPPTIYLSTDDYKVIIAELDKSEKVFKKNIKEQLDKQGYNFSYDLLNVAFGVYFRVDHFYDKKNVIKESNVIQQTLIIDDTIKTEVKVDLSFLPAFKSIIENLKTERWKNFAFDLFQIYCPKQFFIMPASMHASYAHEITELSYGAFSKDNPIALEHMGGKCFHSIRVAELVSHIIHSDQPEITKRNGTISKYVYGNEYNDWEEDMLIIAGLSHDIYSGGTDDNFNYKRRSLDKMHPYYHREALSELAKKYLPENEWNIYLTVIENHMWKWSPKECTIFFSDGKKSENKDEFYNTYRLVKYLEISDYLASQRDTTRAKEIMHFIKAYKMMFDTYDIPEEILIKLNITDEELKLAFGHSDLNSIISVLQKIEGV